MNVRITTNGTVRHRTNNVGRAVRFAARHGGTVQRCVFGQWVDVAVPPQARTHRTNTSPFAVNSWQR